MEIEETKMTYENRRRTRLLKEALGDEHAPLPSARETCLTIAAMIGAIIVLVLAGRNLPDSAAASTIAQRHAAVTIKSDAAPDAGVTATRGLQPVRTPSVRSEEMADSETGNVVHLSH